MSHRSDVPGERRWAALLWVVAPSVIAWIVADTVPTHQYLCFAEKQRYYPLPSHSETELHATLIVASQCSSVELRVSFAAHRSGALRRASNDRRAALCERNHIPVTRPACGGWSHLDGRVPSFRHTRHAFTNRQRNERLARPSSRCHGSCGLASWCVGFRASWRGIRGASCRHARRRLRRQRVGTGRVAPRDAKPRCSLSSSWRRSRIRSGRPYRHARRVRAEVRT